MSHFRGGPVRFTEEDRALAMALTLFDASLCDGCAQHKGRSHHPEMDGWYDVEEDVCYGCDAVEKYTDGKDLPRSVKLHVVENKDAPTVLPDLPPA